jgi:UDP-N-acetylmuramoyl-tripeptide--D-alanyl-D-alanine ligase
MRFDKQFLMKALPNAILKYDNFPHYLNVSVDSRTISKDDVFVALKGQFVDGHDYISEVLAKEAAGLIIEESKLAILDKIDATVLKEKLVVIVKDGLQALVQLATAWRAQFNCTVVGITGSVGKSSTKEILRNILNEYGVSHYVSCGNQNSLIGASINILKMREVHQIAVFELGISARGEMAQLVGIVKPTIGVITSIGHSHMAGLGALSDIAEEKRMIFKFFKENNIGIINGDQSLLSQIGYVHPVIKFGFKTTNQIQARKIRFANHKIQFTLKIYQQKFVNVKINGNHECVVYNSLGAAAVACLLNIPAEIIVRGIELPIHLKGRFEMKAITGGQGGMIIDDCYNASPESVKAALLGFDRLQFGDYQKIVVLSDMNELGVDAPFWHRQIGRILCKMSSLDGVLLIGNHIREVEKTLPIYLKAKLATNWEVALDFLQTKLKTEKLLLLVKGSTFGYTQGLAKLVAHLTDKQADIKPSKILTNGPGPKNLSL